MTLAEGTGAVTTKTNPYLFNVEGEEGGAAGLRATRCRACTRFTLGRVMICAHCFSREVEPAVAGRTAKLVEYSIAHHPAGGFTAPYAIGLIQTGEELSLFAPIAGATDALRAGMSLRFITVPHDGGAVGFAYTPERS